MSGSSFCFCFLFRTQDSESRGYGITSLPRIAYVRTPSMCVNHVPVGTPHASRQRADRQTESLTHTTVSFFVRRVVVQANWKELEPSKADDDASQYFFQDFGTMDLLTFVESLPSTTS